MSETRTLCMLTATKGGKFMARSLRRIYELFMSLRSDLGLGCFLNSIFLFDYTDLIIF